ncbi:hypothetical protein BIFLH666_00498 [Bifidobacterium longum subsp. infantis]|nr:hypothetical protein BIFLH666_00498 [Bifidobacterium longum subsp. infantis]
MRTVDWSPTTFQMSVWNTRLVSRGVLNHIWVKQSCRPSWAVMVTPFWLPRIMETVLLVGVPGIMETVLLVGVPSIILGYMRLRRYVIPAPFCFRV